MGTDILDDGYAYSDRGLSLNVWNFAIKVTKQKNNITSSGICFGRVGIPESWTDDRESGRVLQPHDRTYGMERIKPDYQTIVWQQIRSTANGGLL